MIRCSSIATASPAAATHAIAPQTLTEAAGTPAVFPEFQWQVNTRKGSAMTYDPNRPRVAREREGIRSNGMIAGAIAASWCLLACHNIAPEMNRDDQTASTTPPSTTGQTQKAPAPAPFQSQTPPKAQ